MQLSVNSFTNNGEEKRRSLPSSKLQQRIISKLFASILANFDHLPKYCLNDQPWKSAMDKLKIDIAAMCIDIDLSKRCSASDVTPLVGLRVLVIADYY